MVGTASHESVQAGTKLLDIPLTPENNMTVLWVVQKGKLKAFTLYFELKMFSFSSGCMGFLIVYLENFDLSRIFGDATQVIIIGRSIL